MDYIAKGFYRELLDEQWERGFISKEMTALAEICNCPVKVMEKVWPQIASCFPENEAGMLLNPKLEAQRTEKDAHRVKQANAGRSGAFAKASLANAGKSQKESGKSHIAEQSREEKKQSREELKTSRAERASDPRHSIFKDEVKRYMEAKKAVFVWDASEAKAMYLLLKATPGMDLSILQQCLYNRARSPGTPHGERPRLWLPNVTRYQNQPLNEFGKTETSNGNRHSKTGGNLDAAAQAFAILERQERDSEGVDDVQPETAGGGEPGDVGPVLIGSVEVQPGGR